MKNSIVFTSLLFATIFFVTACNNDSSTAEPAGPNYHIDILSPGATDKHVGDDLHIKVDFSEENSGVVHHINVKIYDAADTTKVIFDLPTEEHIHETSGFYEFDQMFILDSTIVQPNSDWILKASVWGHDDGIAEVFDSIGFHVLPE